MRLAFAALLAAIAPWSAQAAPTLSGLHVTNGSAPFQGDGPMLTTVSPNGDGFRDAAHVFFTLSAPAKVQLTVVQTDTVGSDPEHPILNVFQKLPVRSLPAGPGQLIWRPAASTPPRTYGLDLTVTSASGASRVYAISPPGDPRVAPIVRVQGVDAGFQQPSYAPGDLAKVTVATDAKSLTFQVFAYSGGAFPTDFDTRINAEAMTTGATVDWSSHRDAPATIDIVRPGNWPSGLYFLRVSASDGRVGYAPFVVRPKTLGQHRVAVVLATQTWQAYNFEDENGDGWGDSWYVSGRTRSVDLSRPFLDFGLPYRFGDWDLAFLTWLQQTGKQVDFLTDADLNSIASGDALRKAYRLIVFPGHEEYTTAKEYATIQRFRDLGGNLAFLSANNFFWQVSVEGSAMRKLVQWRNAGQPESSLAGAQYVGSNHGSVLLPFIVSGATQAPWLFAGTGLTNGSSFGNYGIEVDAADNSSPPGTMVLATIPNVLGNGVNAEMTYYELSNGAKVFDAGALDFAASANVAPVSTMLQNLWTRLSQ